MTIAAAYLTSDGVVLGADSTTAARALIPGPDGTYRPGVAQVLNHTQKVLEVGDRSRFGLCTYGNGTIGQTSHRRIAALAADTVNHETATVLDVANAIIEQVQVAASEGQLTFLGYFVGGWDAHTRQPACYRIEFRGDEEPRTHELEIGEYSFGGSREYIWRVLHGYDDQLPDLLLGEIQSSIDDLPPDFEQAYRRAFQKTAQALTAVGFADLPIREAIDLVHTYLHVTIKVAKFRFGYQPVGGPIEIGYVTADRLFRWACHKEHTSAIIQEEDVVHDHA